VLFYPAVLVCVGFLDQNYVNNGCQNAVMLAGCSRCVSGTRARSDVDVQVGDDAESDSWLASSTTILSHEAAMCHSTEILPIVPVCQEIPEGWLLLFVLLLLTDLSHLLVLLMVVARHQLVHLRRVQQGSRYKPLRLSTLFDTTLP